MTRFGRIAMISAALPALWASWAGAVTAPGNGKTIPASDRAPALTGGGGQANLTCSDADGGLTLDIPGEATLLNNGKPVVTFRDECTGRTAP